MQGLQARACISCPSGYCFVTWRADQRCGYLTSLASAALWLVVDRLTGARPSSPLVVVWNFSTRLAFFSGSVLLLAGWKRAGMELASKVEQRTAALRRLASQLSAAEEAERRRLAYDMHDGLSQTLSMIRIELDAAQLDAADRPEVQRRLAECGATVEGVIQQTRTLMFDLYPAMLDGSAWRRSIAALTWGHAAEVLADLRKIVLKEEPRRMLQHAPVLLIPSVFPPEFCRELIDVWETQGNEDSGFMKQVDGQTVGVMDYGHKIRRDDFLTNENPLTGRIKRHLAGRVIPEMITAFNYEVTRFEDFRVACYDASRGGYFRPHRDNTTDGTAHRRFAMSLLLNDDYEGGSLRFPEYGPHTYRPEAGGAVIFSCSLLHEATDVSAGGRFVLLSFFYGEKEARMREEYNRRTGGGYRA